EDISENFNEESSYVEIEYDITPPELNINHTNNTVPNSYLVDLIFTEPVNNFNEDDILITNATITSLNSITSNQFELLIDSEVCDPIVISVYEEKFDDIAGNSNVENSEYTIEQNNTPISVILNLMKNEIAQNPIVNVEFSSPIINLVKDTFTVVNGTALNLLAIDTKTYELEIEPNPNFENIMIQLQNNVVEDFCQNTNNVSNLIEIDIINPRSQITLSQLDSFDGYVVVEIDFSIEPIGFSEQNLSLVNFEVQDFYSMGSNSFIVYLAPLEEDYASIQILENVTNNIYGFGNLESEELEIDVMAPIISISNLPEYTNNPEQTLALTVSETVSSELLPESISLTGASIISLDKIQENEYELSIFIEVQGEILLDLSSESIYDLAGNPNVFQSKILTIFDDIRPNFTFEILADTLVIVSSEPVTNLRVEDLNLENIIVESIVNNGQEYRIPINNITGIPASISIKENQVFDQAGNGNIPLEPIIINSVTNSTSFDEINQIITYPNPFDDFIIIDYNDLNVIDRVELVSINGNVIQPKYFKKAQQLILDTSSLNKGIYFLRVNGNITKLFKNED
ncbi:MAG: Ig-like domain-containing protein, partial [Fulvivirga sp.]|uniref:Ig-like domain-containing protein n=1 Tax=Fulvivirga sp. TaxID=1931237 RepID=UPI0032EAA002